ncbi:MAG: sensor histidine kinase [Chromatiales bacterium]|jgi:signal transduction histidine kinase
MEIGIHSRKLQVRHSTAFVLLFLLLTALLLIVITEQRQADFRKNQGRLMAAMSRSTANEIALLVKKYRSAVTLFAEDNQQALLDLLQHPTDEQRLAHLQNHIRRHFPNFFAFTIAAADGRVLLDDFEGLVGDVCKRDVRNFASTRHPYEIFVHPHAEVYHFDMPVALTPDKHEPIIFFVSFRLDEIARLLFNGAPPEHEFILVNAKDTDLIEVTANGSREVLGENIRLDEARKSRIGYRVPVAGSNWLLLDMPAEGLFKTHHQEVYRYSLAVFLLALLGSLLALKRMHSEEDTRLLAEATLREKNLALEESNRMLRDTRDQLVEAEKMASLAGLVAGIAHEINTPVGIAVTAVSTIREQSSHIKQLLKDNQLKRSDFERFIDRVSEAGGITDTNLQRASELIRSFKQMAVDQSNEKRRNFQLCSYIENVLVSLQPQVKPSGHQVEVKCDGELPVMGYPGAMSQIITNLVMNSLTHAFHGVDAGKMTISIRRIDDSVELIYQDNGQGVPVEDLARIFEPFFTTARDQGGSGLGLSVVYNLVVNLMHGSLHAVNTQGDGFCVVMNFPVEITDDKEDRYLQ